MTYEHEQRVFSDHLIDLLSHEGRYVVVKGDALEGPFDTYEAALDFGYGAYGPVPFLVKQIHEVEPIHYFSRDLPCPA